MNYSLTAESAYNWPVGKFKNSSGSNIINLNGDTANIPTGAKDVVFFKNADLGMVHLTILIFGMVQVQLVPEITIITELKLKHIL